MKQHKTIKELILEACVANSFLPSYEELTKMILEEFPNSKWKKTHYTWYKSKIKNGEIEIPGISRSEDNDKLDEIDEELFSLSVEQDLQDYLIKKIDSLEDGLTIFKDGIEYKTKSGFIDLLAIDKHDSLVVIELKAGKAKDSALGQLLGYIGSIMDLFPERNVRGILVASDFEMRVVNAVKHISNIELKQYQVLFNFNEINE